MASTPNARGPETDMELEASFFLVGISWAGKLAWKGGKSSEMEGKHIALPTWTLQGPVPTQT